MAHSIKLGTISKHEESTKRPNMSGWKEYPVVFKDGTDIVNPTITISADLATISACNYGYMMGRYYWIRGITSYRTGYVILDLETDVLATYKSDIGSSSLYILRSANSSDGNIQDTWYPITSKRTVSGQNLDTDQISFSQGCYIVNIMGNQTGSSTLFLMSPDDFNDLITALLAIAGGYTSLNFSQAVVNAIFDPMDYIKSVIWLPISYSDASLIFGTTTTSGNLCAGLWDSGIKGHMLNDAAALIKTYSVTLPKHPQATARGAFLNGSPYTEYILDYEPFGVVNIDATRLISDTTLTINIYVDAISGLGILKAGGNNSGPVVSRTAQYGVPIPLSGASANVSSAVGAIAGAGEMAAGIITANPIMLAAGAAGIGNVANSIHGVVSTTGSAGTMAAFQTFKTFGAIFHHITDEDNTRNGRPYCKVATPASIPGFMIAQRGDIHISGTLPEQQRIKMFLESGFFYE